MCTSMIVYVLVVLSLDLLARVDGRIFLEATHPLDHDMTKEQGGPPGQFDVILYECNINPKHKFGNVLELKCKTIKKIEQKQKVYELAHFNGVSDLELITGHVLKIDRRVISGKLSQVLAIGVELKANPFHKPGFKPFCADMLYTRRKVNWLLPSFVDSDDTLTKKQLVQFMSINSIGWFYSFTGQPMELFEIYVATLRKVIKASGYVPKKDIPGATLNALAVSPYVPGIHTFPESQSHAHTQPLSIPQPPNRTQSNSKGNRMLECLRSVFRCASRKLSRLRSFSFFKSSSQLESRSLAPSQPRYQNLTENLESPLRSESLPQSQNQTITQFELQPQPESQPNHQFLVTRSFNLSRLRSLSFSKRQSEPPPPCCDQESQKPSRSLSRSSRSLSRSKSRSRSLTRSGSFSRSKQSWTQSWSQTKPQETEPEESETSESDEPKSKPQAEYQTVTVHEGIPRPPEFNSLKCDIMRAVGFLSFKMLDPCFALIMGFDEMTLAASACTTYCQFLDMAAEVYGKLFHARCKHISNGKCVNRMCVCVSLQPGYPPDSVDMLFCNNALRLHIYEQKMRFQN